MTDSDLNLYRLSHRNVRGWECTARGYTCAGQALARGENLDRLVQKTDDLRYVHRCWLE
jgi:hypothetical protein